MWQVFIKELLELVRDKKTMFFVIALPVIIFPVLFGGIAFLAANLAMDEHKKVLNFALLNSEQAPEFSQALVYHRDFKQVKVELADEQAIRKSISDGVVDVVIEIPADFNVDSALQAKVGWKVYFNNSSQLNSVNAKVNKVFNKYLDGVRESHLKANNITQEQYELIKTPIALEIVNTADQRENIGEQIGGMIPYILIILCMTGAMYPAIDIGAGEKERGTLETLLLTPINRTELVLGKFFTIMFTSIMSALITVTSMAVWGTIIGQMVDVEEITKVIGSISFFDIFLMVLMLIPIAAIFAALLLAISIYAKSFKEAQNYMGPVTMLGFVPVLIAMLPGIKLDSFWAYVPLTNVSLAIKEILKGTIEYSSVIGIFISTVIFALFALWFCVTWFKREQVLFR